MEVLNALLTSSLFNLLSLVLGLIGLFLAWYFYRKGLSTKEPLWASRNINLIEGFSTKVSGLEIKFKGAPVENLSISRLAIWNNGRLTINGDDISLVDPLRIVGKSTNGNKIRILDATILKLNNEPSQLRIDTSDGVVNIKFDYLDRNHGAVIQVLHDGVELKNISIEGTIKGAPSIKRAKILRLKNFPIQLPDKVKRIIPVKTRRIVSGIFTLFIAIMYIVFAGVLVNSNELGKELSLILGKGFNNALSETFLVIFRLLTAGSVALIGIYILVIATRLIRSVIPESLEDTFEGEIIN